MFGTGKHVDRQISILRSFFGQWCFFCCFVCFCCGSWPPFESSVTVSNPSWLQLSAATKGQSSNCSNEPLLNPHGVIIWVEYLVSMSLKKSSDIFCVNADERVPKYRYYCMFSGYFQPRDRTYIQVEQWMDCGCATHLSPWAKLCFNTHISILPPAVDKRYI